MRRDLYTTTVVGRDSDELEVWLAREFEEPGIEASKRAIQGARLSADDWEALIRLYAAQEVRTPQSFAEFMSRWDRDLQGVIEETMKEGIAEWANATAAGRQPRGAPTARNEFTDLFRVRVHRPEETGGEPTLSATVVLGRRLWVASVRHLLTGRAMEKLLRQSWHILKPADGYEWPLTDHPTLRLGFRSPDDFSFGAGWGQRHADLVMPLSPQHLLHTEVGKVKRGITQLSPELTSQMRSFLVRRAHRLVFATSPSPWVTRERVRVVDSVQFDRERDDWERWHAEQAAAESDWDRE